MIEISNRHYDIIMDKLPRVITMARKNGASLTLRQCEDIRQLLLLHTQLKKKKKSNK